MCVIEFQEAIRIAESLEAEYPEMKKYLFLGNGFSIACKPDKFNYAALLEEVHFGQNNQEIKDIFNEFNTKDFEKIIKQLLDASKILNHYEGNAPLSAKLEEEAIIIREQLIRVLADKHPSIQNEIHDTAFESCIVFLSGFNKIFTTNYDLLLYWTLMKERENANRERRAPLFEIVDGFGYRDSLDKRLIWPRNSSLQNVFYLHGALHLFLNEFYETQKLYWDQFLNPLVSQIQDNLENNRFPLFVAEGSWREKLEKIKGHGYLDAAFVQFQKMQGCLFIHGHSLDCDSDMHILKAIAENTSIKKVFVSVFNPEENLNQMNSKAAFLKSLRRGTPELEVDFYDAESARVWDNGRAIFGTD